MECSILNSNKITKTGQNNLTPDKGAFKIILVIFIQCCFKARLFAMCRVSRERSPGHGPSNETKVFPAKRLH